MQGGAMSPPYPSGQPAGNKPVSIAGTGSTPPTYANSQAVPDRTAVAASRGMAGTEQAGASGGPKQVPGQSPPSGTPKAPKRPTSPTDKSKSVGVE